MYSQQLQLMRTTEIQTPIISHGSFVTEKLGLKMEIPSAEWTDEETVISREQSSANTEWQYRQLVRTMYTQLYTQFIYFYK